MGLTRYLQLIIASDAVHVEDDFIEYLYQIIEELSDDANDPYHYPVIRVLVSIHS